jgi:hypothetical protein
MLTIKANAANAAQYRRMLRSDWKRGLADDVLALLWATVGHRTSASVNSALGELLNPKSTRPLPQPLCSAVVERVINAGKFLNRNELPPLSDDYVPPARPTKLAAHAVRLATYLTLQAHVDLSGNVAFFRDVQALAFQAALHGILPEIRDKHVHEHAFLLHALALFAAGSETPDPAHASYLRSLIQGCLGRTDERLHALLASFRLTPPEDHSYLTKAQEYWSELLDLERYAQAEEFLFSLHWRALPAPRDEIRAMIVDAIQYATANAR